MQARDPSIDDYFRTFMMPGMFHCRGGAGADRFDAMTPLIEWVEQGHAPVQLDTWRLSGDGERRDERPSCAYPAEALPARDGTLICLPPGAVELNKE